jgi:hypothetical protein
VDEAQMLSEMIFPPEFTVLASLRVMILDVLIAGVRFAAVDAAEDPCVGID